MKRSEAVALLSSAFLASPSAVRAQGPRARLRVGANPGESLAEGLLAAEGGFFSKAGIDAEVVTVTNGGAMTAGIVSGAIDIGPSNVASISAAYVRGLQLNLFAPSVLISSSNPPTTIIAVLKDSPLRTAKDFAGKTFALSTVRDLQQAAVMTWLDKNGGDSKSATFIEIPNPEQLAALEAKRVDAALLVEPFLSASKNDTRMVARPYSSLASQLMTFGWIANKSWYDANPALVGRVVGVIRATAQWANRNHAATATIISNISKVPKETFLTMNRQVFSEGKLDPALIQPIIDASAHYGFLTRAFPASEMFAPNAG
ncbi:MAG TPA: ABC transporter substrate-binding protein [Candidatus Binatia bacterium]|nr:ABC transporter substrate-binding protein [Candidatus Binatia bacterium]